MLKKDTIILALETSQKTASIAIIKEKMPVSSASVNSLEQVSEILIKRIDELFDANDLKLSNVGLIAVSLGPGSLNGIRVGIAAAQGLAFSIGVKCLGIPLFDAVAYYFRKGNERILVGYNHRQNYYWKLFDENQERNEIESGSELDFQNAASTSQNYKQVSALAETSDQGVISLATIVGLRSSEAATEGIGTNLTPVYLEGTNFKKLSFE